MYFFNKHCNNCFMNILNDLLRIVLFSGISVVTLFFISKILGKKQIAQLDFIDYVNGITIGSIGAEMATDLTDLPFYYYIVAMIIFFLFDLFISLVGRKTPWLKNFFKGRPSMLINANKLDYKILKQNKLDINDLISLCREQGYFDLSLIKYAILEPNGQISIMPMEQIKPVTVTDINAPLKKQIIPCYLYCDGVISKSGLNFLNKDVEWLFKKLNVKNKKELKKYLIIYTADNGKTLEKVCKN